MSGQPAVSRKLTTILCADVEGYSRLMGGDEAATLDRLKQHRAAMAGLVERHRGRIVNTWGDGVIADFPSVVEAVQCAIETQRELAARNEDLPADRRLEFRIGINLGDVMVDGGDLYGEGVNVAARLQGLAPPGGIVISGAVHDQVRGKLTVGYETIGPQQVKNIADPVPAFLVTLDATRPRRQPPAFEQPSIASAPNDRRRRTLLRAGIVIAFLFLINLFTMAHGGGFWFHWPALGIAFLMALRWTRGL